MVLSFDPERDWPRPMSIISYDRGLPSNDDFSYVSLEKLTADRPAEGGPPMAERLPPLNALRCFGVAAKHLSFTKAAAELNVTHSAVSHQIKALEEWLGVPLFRRINRGL